MNNVILQTVQWSSLTHIDDVKPLDDGDAAVLTELRDVLVRHGRLGKFGVCLLHKHFELAENEIAVEYTDVDSRTSTVIVEPAQQTTAGKHIETLWRFKQDGPASVTVCEQKCYYNQGHRAVHVKVGR